MCGRFTLTQGGKMLTDAFGLAELELDELADLPPRYNIAPTQRVTVVRWHDDRPQLAALQWGLIPSWAKDSSISAKLINARAETVSEKPSFRSAFKRRRCLVAADGFYEWQRREGKKQPFYFALRDRQPFGFAGLWETWTSESGEAIESCTIITTAANDLMQPIHDRMPVILPRDAYRLWLDPTVQSIEVLQPWLMPYAETAMQAHPVTTKVNNPRFEQAECIQALDLAAS